jgi:hypothetical protein
VVTSCEVLHLFDQASEEHTGDFIGTETWHFATV